MTLNWMAWTTPTAVFFLFIVSALVVLTLWEIKVPGGSPRRGVLRFETTRGDRLFVTLLGSYPAWFGLYPPLMARFFPGYGLMVGDRAGLYLWAGSFSLGIKQNKRTLYERAVR